MAHRRGGVPVRELADGSREVEAPVGAALERFDHHHGIEVHRAVDVRERLDGGSWLLPTDLGVEMRLVEREQDEPSPSAVEEVRRQERLVGGRGVDEPFRREQRIRPVLASIGRRFPLRSLGDVDGQLSAPFAPDEGRMEADGIDLASVRIEYLDEVDSARS